MALLVGTYDASTFVLDDTSTYPQLPAGVTLYQPGMHWLVTVEGTVFGQTAHEGDLLFALPSVRPYGSYTFGDFRYGGSDREGSWTVDEVWFLVWVANLPPPDQVPYPNSGCPFTSPEQPLGHWAPGWRIVVDAWFDDDTLTRRYGTSFYGNEVYGSNPSPLGGARWVDITEPSFTIEMGDGMQDGGPRVTVSEVDIQFIDPTGRWFDIAEPITWTQPQPGTPLRVGLIDPFYRYHPLISAEIERIEDVHDGEHPRVVAVRAFGRIMDLVVDVPQVTMLGEMASTRITNLAIAAGWRWDTDGIAFPPTGDAPLTAEVEPRDIVVRDEMDKSCQAVGWFLDSSRQGRMRVREWPHVPSGEPLLIVDCHHGEAQPKLGRHVAHQMMFLNDESQLLNYVVTTNNAKPDAASIVRQDVMSVERYGKRGRAHGFPQSGLPWADAAAAAVWVERVRSRFSFITRQVEALEVDTHVDRDWLATLADLDTGRAVTIERTGLRPLKMQGVVVGWRHRLSPGRWTASLFVSTITQSF